MSEKTVVVPAVPQQRGTDPGYELSAMLRAASFIGGAGTSTTQRRIVRNIDPKPRDLRGVTPLRPAGFVDGTQNSLLIRHVEHRPLMLSWVAAGAVTRGAKVLKIRQRTDLIASHADADLGGKLSAIGNGVSVHVLDELTPWGIAAATQTVIDEWRRELERDIVNRVAIPDGSCLVVDGPIRQYERDGLVGIVKSVDVTQYLGDESMLPERAGWRSGVFELPATTAAERGVLSCYLRLHDAPGSRPWSHGLIRIEAQDLDMLDAGCAMALGERQGPGSGDARWSVHLEAMHTTEEALRAFRPWLFERL